MIQKSTLYLPFILIFLSFLNPLVAQEETPMKIRRGDVSVFGAVGRADFYRENSDRFKPFGAGHQDAWMTGISLRTGDKLYELRLDAYFARQGGKETFDTFTNGIVESDVSLSYLGLRLLPLNLRFQKTRFYVHGGIGAYGSVLLQSEIKVNDQLFEESPLQELSPFDYGPVLSIGLGYGKFNLVCHYQAGLEAIDATAGTARNQLLSLGLNIWI